MCDYLVGYECASTCRGKSDATLVQVKAFIVGS